MTAALMTDSDQKEALSFVYVRAVAARAGYVIGRSELDRDSIDLRIESGEPMRPALDLQLKATANLNGRDDCYFRFTLNRKNYDDLRIPTQTPRLLVVLDLPRRRDQWVTITEDKLVLRRRAYWLSLVGRPQTDNQVSVTVQIPRRNVFDVNGLRALMDQSREGRIQ